MGEIILDTGINTAGLKAGSKEMLSAIRSFGSRVKSGSRDVTRAVQSFGKQSTRQILSTGKSVLSMIAGVSSAMSVLHKAISSYMSKHQETATKLQTAWGALGEVMGPVLERVVNLITTAISYLITFLHLVGLSSKTASQAAADANKAAGAMQRSILSFDDLTKLQVGGGGGATGTLQDIDPDEWMKKLTELLKEGMWRDAGILLGLRVNELIDSVDWIGIGDKIGYNFGGAISTIAWSIRTIDWKNLGAQLVSGFNAMISNINGADLGSLLVAKWTIVIDILGGFFEGVAYEEIGEKLNAMLNQAVEDLTKSLQNADTDKIGTGLGQMLAKIDWIRLGKNFGAFLRWSFLKATDLFIAFLKSTPWKDIGDGIGAMFNEIDWNEVGTIIFEILGLAFQAGVGLLIGFLQTTSWKDVGEGLRAMIGKIDPKEIGDELFGVLKAAAQAAFDLLDGFFGGNDTYSKIKGWLNDIVETFREFAHTIQMVSDVTSGKKTWSEALEEMRKYSEERQRLQMEAAGYKVVPEIPSSDDTELEGLTAAADALTHKLTEAGNAYRTLVQTDYSEANQKKFESVVRAIYQMLTEPYQDVEEAQTAVENLEAALQGVIDSYSELAENPTDETWEAVNGKLIEELRKHCDDYVDELKDANLLIEENGRVIQAASKDVDDMAASTAAVRDAQNGSTNAAADVGDALLNMGDSADSAGASFEGLGDDMRIGASEGEAAITAMHEEIVCGMSDLVGDVDKSSLVMSESFAEGATEMGEKASEMTRDVNTVMQQNMATIASNAYIWGQDIINEFARGMVSRFNSTLAPALYSVAKGIWSYLHFSEPEVGPLSDFHTYMPDMMRLMAEGIAQNRDLPIGAVENVTERIAGTVGKIQDIANNVVFTQPQIAAGNLLPYSVSGGINAGGIDSSGTSLSDVLSAISSLRSAITGSGNGEITLNLVVELDGEKITEKVTRLQRRDLRAMGV